MTYSLAYENYTWKNALLWGNFTEHCKKASQGSLGNRAVHAVIAACELLPIVGQIASIFEKIIIQSLNKKASQNQLVAMADDSVQDDMRFSQLEQNAIGSEAGVYVLSRCKDDNCSNKDEEQWIPQKLSTKKSWVPQWLSKNKSKMTFDIAEIQENLSCSSCRISMNDIEKVALVGCSALLVYRDQQGKHEKAIAATNGVAEVLEWSSPLKYMSLKNVSIN